MNITETIEILESADLCGHVPLLVSAHGVGKTESCKQYAKNNNLHLEVLMLSLFDTSDLIGIPFREQRGDSVVTRWAQPIWLQRIIEAHERGQRSVLLLDEINRAQPDVIGASLQLVLDKRLNEHQLPLDTFIVTAINPDNGAYNVNSLDPAMLDRMVVCDIEADAPSWVSWASKSGVNQKVIDFIIKSPNKLHAVPADQSKGSSPRSWTRLAQYITAMEAANKPISTYYVKGTIGGGLAAEFIAFYNNYVKQLSVPDIIKHYNKSKSKPWDTAVESMSKYIDKLEALQKSELAIALADHFKNETDDEKRKPYLCYLYALPVEQCVAYLKSMKDNIDKADEWANLIKFDEAVNNKQLFRRIVQAK